MRQRSIWVGIALTAILAVGGPLLAQTPPNEVLKFDIAPQSLDSALLEFSEQAGLQLVVPAGLLEDMETAGFAGEETAERVLGKLLKNTDLEFTKVNATVAITRAAEDSTGGGETTGRQEPDEPAPAQSQENTEAEEPEAPPSRSSASRRGEETVVVTGTRLDLNPAEATGNLMVIDRETLLASGELMLHRALRQLPQNVNGTTPVAGADLNGGTNFSGAATVNLRGLGSDSTLILVNGRRIGSHGLTGGVTDISSIPLDIVERVEILFEGASAVYGSDAAGGVINIITRKDQDTVDVSMAYSAPTEGGFREIVARLNAGLGWQGGRIRVGFERSDHSGLHASSRTLLVPGEYSNPHIYNLGPQLLGRSAGFLPTPVFYTGPGGNITVSEFGALSPAEQGSYAPVLEFMFPEDFNGDIDTITDLEALDFPVEISGRNRTLLPLQERSSVHLGLEQEILPDIDVNADVTYALRDVETRQGNLSLDAVWEPRSPSNPFGERVALRGWVPGDIPVSNLNDGRDFNANVALKGQSGADKTWKWEVGVGHSRNESDTVLVNVLSGDVRPSVASDGVTPQFSFFTIPTQISTADCQAQGGILIVGGAWCQISRVFPHIDPFNDDLSQYIDEALPSGSENQQTRFDALLRGQIFNTPGGPVKVLVGGSWQEEGLDTRSDIPSNSTTIASPIFGGTFDSTSTREQRALFLEGYAPVVSVENATAGINKLGFSFAARWDEYLRPESSRFGERLENLCEGDNTPAGVECDTAFADVSYSFGAVYAPLDDQLRFRANWSTAFVAPQLNQLIRPPVATSRRFDVRMPLPAGGVCPSGTLGPFPGVNACFVPVVAISGGNPTLDAETSDTISVGFDLRPGILPGLDGRVTWSRLKSDDQITALSVLAIPDLDTLPSNMRRETINFDPVSGQPSPTPMDVIINDRRATNVAEIQREGIDVLLGFQADTDMGGFDVWLNYTKVIDFRVTDDPATGQPVSIVGETEFGAGIPSPSLPAVAEHSFNVRAAWSIGGVAVSANGNYRSATNRILHITDGSRIDVNTQQPTIWNLGLRYSFAEDTLFAAPDWLRGSVLNLRLNNVTNDFIVSEYVEFDAMGELVSTEPFDLSPSSTFASGRSFGIELRTSF